MCYQDVYRGHWSFVRLIGLQSFSMAPAAKGSVRYVANQKTGNVLSALEQESVLQHPSQPEHSESNQHQPGGKCNDRRIHTQQQSCVGYNLVEQVNTHAEHCRENQSVGEPGPYRTENEWNGKQ